MPRRRSGKKIDFVHWTPITGTIAAQAAGTAAVNMLPANHEPETLMRIRGNLLCYLDATQAPGGLAQISVGLIAVPEGTGTTVLWSPTTDGDAPFIWAETFFVGYEEYVTDVIDAVGLPLFRKVIDNKAMRILRNQELQLVLENTTILAAASVNLSVAARVLSGT